MRLPIRTRLTAVYSAIFCIGMIALEVVTYVGLNAAIETVVDRDLEARLAGVVDYVDNHIAKLSLARFQHDLAGHGTLRPEWLIIRDMQAGDIFESPALRETALSRRASPSPRFMSTQAGPVRVRVLLDRRAIRGHRYELILATDLSGTSEIIRYFRLLLILLTPVILAASAAAGYAISARALTPVSDLTRAAGKIGAPCLSQRLTVHQSGDEIEELALTLNRMLARIESSFLQIRQFTSDASHELRTPLAAIRATTEVALLNPSGSADSYRQALHRVLGEAERNTVLLDNMLRLARADSATVVPISNPVDLEKKLAQACERMANLATENRIQLRTSIPVQGRGDLRIGGDSDQLIRLCLILLDNAIKYTPGGGTVTVEVNRVGETVSLSVTDTGIGISDDDLARIFERFYRADAVRTSGSGSGLGLAIAKAIVESHRATIHVRSSLGSGSTFRVDFPALLSTAALSPRTPHAVIVQSL